MDSKKQSKTVKYLFFTLDNEKYALNTDMIQEVVDCQKITKVPKSNPAIRGVTNIRGELIAVIDPRVRFKNIESEILNRTSFIIVTMEGTKKNILVALMVDLVLEVDDIDTSDILRTPEFGMKIEKHFIENIIRDKNNYITVLNIKNVINITELSQRG